ncbi:MAG: ATP-grasp domain-containing protein [bacterium]
MKGILLRRTRVGRENVNKIIDKMETDVTLFQSRKGNITPSVSGTTENDQIIRWGCTSYLHTGIKFNKTKSIKNASNKLKARKLMESADIPIPKTYSLNELTYNENIIDKLPLIGRPKKHFGGRKFFYCESIVDVRNSIRKGAEYFTEFYPKSREFRVHVAHGKVLICSEKFVDDINTKVWNLRQNDDGEFQAIRWSEIPTNIAELGINAVKVLNLDFGAVDIISEPLEEGYKPAVVLEVNTAPKLGEYGSERYAEYFDWLFRVEGKREHKEVEDYSYWRHFVWSHEALKGSDE